MTTLSTTSGGTTDRAIVGVFDDRTAAEKAVDELQRAGFKEDQIGFVIRGADDVLGGMIVDAEGTKDGKGALTGAERMRLAIKALSFETAKGPLSVTSSFGVALWMPGESGHDVLERSDQQLYKAKSRGRDRVVGE